MNARRNRDATIARQKRWRKKQHEKGLKPRQVWVTDPEWAAMKQALESHRKQGDQPPWESIQGTFSDTQSDQR